MQPSVLRFSLYLGCALLLGALVGLERQWRQLSWTVMHTEME
jgi:uncharacterized membrane protein YhiD involved in acid resistance